MKKVLFNILVEADSMKTRMGWAFVGSRRYQRRDILKLVEMGLMKSVGDVYMCDDDGSMLDPERTREGFEVTREGYKVLGYYQAYLSAETEEGWAFEEVFLERGLTW